MNKNQTVYIVNGLKNPYLVKVNGDGPYRVGSLQASEVTVVQGEINVEVISEDYAIDPFTVNISNTLLSPSFNGDVFVINPDGTAILEVRDIVYADGSVRKGEVDYKPTEFHTGHLVYTFCDVDYSFEETPAEIRLASGRNYELRTLLHFDDAFDFSKDIDSLDFTAIGLYLMQGYISDDDLVRASLKKYQHDGDFAKIGWFLKSTMDPEEFHKIIGRELDNNPLDLSIHRVYQSFLIEKEGWKEALAIYRALATEAGDSPELSYLLALVTPDTDEAIELYKKGLVSKEIEKDCHNALAGIYLSLGEYALAYEHASQLKFIDEQGDFYNEHYEETSVATRNVSGFLPKKSEGEEELHWSVTHSEYSIAIVGIDLGKEAALAYLEESLAKQHSVSTDEEIERFRQHSLLMVELSVGEKETAYQMAKSMLEANLFDPYTAALLRGDTEAALEAYIDEIHSDDEYYEEFLADDDEYDPLGWMPVEEALLLATLARRGRFDEIGKKCFAAALSNLQERNSVPAILVAESLTSDLTENPEPVLNSRLDIFEKKAVLLYLGERDPEKRELYWSLLRKLNFNHDDDCLAYAKLMGDW